MRIGAHVSVAGGIWKCFGNANKIGAETIQIFGSSPQQWKIRILSKTDIEKFKKEHKKSGVDPVFLHGSYLVNLASPNNRIRYGSIKILTDHLKIADMLGAKGLIFHIGSATEGIEHGEAIKKVIKGLKIILKEVPGKTQLIMENTYTNINSGQAQSFDLSNYPMGVYILKVETEGKIYTERIIIK